MNCAIQSSANFPLIRRLIRLEPTYLVSLLMAALVAWSYGESYPAGQLLSHMLYLAPIFGFGWINAVYWTLAYEFIFYLFCAFSFPAIWARPWLILAIAAVVTMVAPRDHQFGGLVPCFAIGAFTVRYFLGIISLKKFIPAIVTLLVFILACGDKSSMVVALCCAIAIIVLRIPESRLTCYLGGISYPLYVFHGPVMTISWSPMARFATAVDNPLLSDIVLRIGVLLSCVCFSYIVHLLIDRRAVALARTIRIS